MVLFKKLLRAAAAFPAAAPAALRAAALTAALAAPLSAAVPSAVYAGVVEGRHAADPASISDTDAYGPGTLESFRAQTSGEGTDLLSAACPEGLEPDLWDAATASLQRCEAAVQADLAAVNALRASVGLPALTLDRELSLTAAYRAAQINKYRHLSHYGAAGEFLADRVAAAVLGSADVYVGENYYYEYSDWIRKYQAPAEAFTGAAAGAAAGTSAGEAYGPGVTEKAAWDPSVEFLKDSLDVSARGQEWLTASPSHYANMTLNDITRIGIGIFISPEGQPVLDTMVQIFR